MSNLLDVDSGRERGLLRIVSFQVDAVFFIVNVVGRYRRVMTIKCELST